MAGLSSDAHGVPPRVLVAGVSTRAIAESAARAGFAVTSIDAFADLDQHPTVRAISLHDRYSARAAAVAARDIECDAVAYTSNFENHPRAVEALASGRALWGNTPAVLRRVRNPALLTQTLCRRQCLAPAVTSGQRLPSDNDGRQWLLKPLASGGGDRVRQWRDGIPLPRRSYLQEFVEGTPASMVFVAGGGRAIALGVSRQLVGDRAFGATGYQYCGNILASDGDGRFLGDVALTDAASALATVVAEEFRVVGVNSVDFIASNGIPHAIEVNPRWSASMELVERAYNISVFGVHATACITGALPTFDLLRVRGSTPAIGKAVVFARLDVRVGDTSHWLADSSVRDVPRPGERILAGRPVCTIIAEGRDDASCYLGLVRQAEGVYATLDAWSR